MKRKKLTKPMRTITQNYWGKDNVHIIPRWLDKDIKVINPKPQQMKLKREYHDTDSDGVPNFADCNLWNPYEQGWIHEQGAKVYNRLRESKLLRKRRVLAENKKDRRLTVYRPSGMDDSVDEENVKRKKIQERRDKISAFGGKVQKKIDKVTSSAPVKFAKDVYKEAQQFNPETKQIPGTKFIWVLVTVKDQAGNVVAQDWVDTGKRYNKLESVEVLKELKRRGYKPEEVKEMDFPVPKKGRIKENIKEGLHIKKEQHTPIAQVMIHAGPSMRGQQVQQAGYSGRSSVGYSPMFVGATRKQFRVGGDR